MTRRTSAVAACSSSASFNCRVSRTTSVSWPPSEKLPRAVGRFDTSALRCRALGSWLLALERLLIASPGFGAARIRLPCNDYSRDLRPAKWGSGISFCTAAILSGPCPPWVKSGHHGEFGECPLYPQKRTSELNSATSALCQKRTFAPSFLAD